MKTLLRLIVALVFLSGAAGSCALAYYVGYVDGLGVFAKSVEPPATSGEETLPAAELQMTEMHVSIDQ